MVPLSSFHSANLPEIVQAGRVLRERSQRPDSVIYLDSGRVLFGLLESGQLRHQLGMVEGPVWLDVAPVLMEQPYPLDIVADTQVSLRRITLVEFRQAYAALNPETQTLIRDMAAGYFQQTELAVSRLAQDAEARCAQWLLRHAAPAADGSLQVTLQQRKRLIAAQLGIAPETFSRVLRHLREHGLIAGTGNVLSLPQPTALQNVARC
ncbi:Crp/Fnr family transcriptional regulator [Diaphorobacter ruginosibacter]|uniref:Crp/Fnr family transcriptional regulator n=1 Tax=Diaphorobacter ruginosibacter TaxID=1715720 RepID=A0A7G9RS30_9BURK|nr:Crp/Fnr family transcriptional regulator [Diaphorobacter ruginosibacter]QNN58405.1 Crp/Fnr family transcriptional regulator [Diaphorobacter ruginosibacter]